MMPNEIYLLIGLGVGLLIGLAGGWILGLLKSKATSSDNRLEEELRAQLQQREKELIELRQQWSEIKTQLATAEANQEASQHLLNETKQSFQQNWEAAKVSQEKALLDLRETFKALSADALKQTQPEFLRLANETLGKFQETAKGDLSQRQQAIATLVEPLKQQLETYQQRLAQSETNQSSMLGEVKKQLEGLAQNSQLLSSETFQLRKVLSSNQARGRWGEETLRRIVEAAGMSAHCDFSEQTQSGDSKPDLVVKLPGNRMIIVDAKVPDLDFLQAIDAADEVKRAEALAAHASKLKLTIRNLAERDYPQQFPHALDMVILFLPAESLFSAALEGDQNLMVWAHTKKILVATPCSLIGILRSISVTWQQHAQTENARQIAATAQELYVRVTKFTEHLERIRSGLERANSAYNDAVGSYERMVRPSGEKLVKLGGGTPDKELTELPLLNSTLRLTSYVEKEEKS